jgi:hypothetical protein
MIKIYLHRLARQVYKEQQLGAAARAAGRLAEAAKAAAATNCL